MLFVGGSRAHHYQELFHELGMEVLGAGYEFAHRDDYEGREVLPNIKVDADSRNIEVLEIEQDPTRYRPRKTPEQIEALKAKGLTFDAYEGMMYELNKKNYDYDRLAEIVTTDAILSFKLLKFVNSPFYGQQTQTTSIKRALLVLGYRELKQWMHINLLSRSATTDIDKELIYLSAFRSKFLSILRETQPSRCNIDLDMCLPSLFSLLDVLLKMPFDAIFEQIHCLDTIKKGLTDHNAPCRKCFTLVQCFEKNESEKIETYRKTFPDIDFDHINYEALGWANSIAR